MRINPETGARMTDGGIPDYFYQEYLPPESEGGAASQTPTGTNPPEEVKDQLF